MKYSVVPSALAYLFGDVLEDVFAGASRFTGNEKLPCREVKVKKGNLVNVMLAAGFVHLAEEGHLKLTLGRKGRIFKSKAVFATLSPQQPSQGLGGLEGQIGSSITGNQKEDDIHSIVRRLVGADSSNPWDDIIGKARGHLLREGYFAEEEQHGITKRHRKKLIPQCEKIAALEGEARQLREMMATFQARQPELYKQLWKDVAAGIASRRETPDIGVGDAFGPD